MRGRLLDATVDCLYRLGYAKTTTTVVCARAGVSRGAQLHHFPTKASLVTTAVEHLFERRHEEFRRAVAALPEHEDRAVAAVELLWEMVSGPTFYSWLELVVAARTDPVLAAAVRDMSARFSETVLSTSRELFPERADAQPPPEITTMMLFATLEGMALQNIVDDGTGISKLLLNHLKQLAETR